MSTATATHWATQYRTASRTTLEGWIYLAACHCQGTEAWIREVGRIAYTSGCCIWHAAWVASGRKGPATVPIANGKGKPRNDRRSAAFEPLNGTEAGARILRAEADKCIDGHDLRAG